MEISIFEIRLSYLRDKRCEERESEEEIRLNVNANDRCLISLEGKEGNVEFGRKKNLMERKTKMEIFSSMFVV